MLEDGGSRRKSAEIFAAQVAAENEGHAAFYGFSLSVGLAYALSVFLRVPIAHEEILETFLKRDELIVSGAFVGVHDEERQGADARIILPRQGPGPVDVMKDALNNMTDTPCDHEFERKIGNCIEEVPGVVRIDALRTRKFGNRVYVDAEIAVDGALPLRDAHAIAERVHHELEHDFPDVKHCTVHVNPA